MLSRRAFLAGSAATLGSAGASPPAAAATRGRAGTGPVSLTATFAKLEAASGGRLGVAVFDGGSGALTGHRLDERFPMCSTFKALAAAAVLARVDAGRERLDRRIRFAPHDVIAYSPITGKRAGGTGMSVAELCEAAITVSDNTAANVLLAALGGPAAVTRYARSIGDRFTRLDRTEPALNASVPGDPRDTTTPAAMAADLRALLLGDALSAASRAQLTAWMRATKTGGARLRAGVPHDWRVADKTGTGVRGSTNDVAVLWPRNGAPLVVAVYLTNTAASSERCDATIAAVGRAVASMRPG